MVNISFSFFFYLPLLKWWCNIKYLETENKVTIKSIKYTSIIQYLPVSCGKLMPYLRQIVSILATLIILKHLPPWTDRQTSHCHHSTAIILVWSAYLCHWQNHLFPSTKKVTVISLCWPGYSPKFYLQIQSLVTDTKKLYLYHSCLRFLVCDFTMSTLPERIGAEVICACCCKREACNCKVFRPSLLKVPWYLAITHFNT